MKDPDANINKMLSLIIDLKKIRVLVGICLYSVKGKFQIEIGNTTETNIFLLEIKKGILIYEGTLKEGGVYDIKRIRNDISLTIIFSNCWIKLPPWFKPSRIFIEINKSEINDDNKRNKIVILNKTFMKIFFNLDFSKNSFSLLPIQL